MLSQQASTLRFGGMKNHSMTTSRYCHSVRTRLVFRGEQRGLKTSTKLQAVGNADESSFEQEVLKTELPCLVDFWATWCGPCKLVAPSMEWADKEFNGKLKVVKVDCTEGNKQLMEKYKVYGLPCLIVFKDGEMVEGSFHEGAITRKGLEKYISDHKIYYPFDYKEVGCAIAQWFCYKYDAQKVYRGLMSWIENSTTAEHQRIALDEFLNNGKIEGFRNIRNPVMTIQGMMDKTAPVGNLNELSNLVPNFKRWVLMDYAGHAVTDDTNYKEMEILFATIPARAGVLIHSPHSIASGS
eukprot:jgi/Picsp_1/2300/NSC_05764-R1_thioredoxin x